MADELRWYLKLFDDVSAPARAAEHALAKLREEFKDNEKVMGGFDKELKKVREDIAKIKLNPGQFKELEVARKELQKLRSEAGGMGGGGAGGGLMAGLAGGAMVAGAGLLVGAAEKIGSVMMKAGSLVLDFAHEAINEAAKAETRKLSFEVMLGKEGAKQALDDIEEMSKKTKFDEDEIADAMRPLLLTGMRAGEDMANAITAATDLEVVTGGGIGAVQGTLDLIKKIRSKDMISEKQLEQVGLNGKVFFADIAKQLGTTAEIAKKKLSAKELGSDMVLGTIYRTIAAQQGGALGIMSGKSAETVEAKLNKLANLPGDYMKKMLESEGFTKFSQSLTRVLDGLSPESENGKRIFAALEDVFNKLMGWIEQLTTAEGMKSVAEGFTLVGDVVSITMTAVKGLVWFVKELYREISNVVAPFIEIGKAAAYIGDAIGDNLAKANNAIVENVDAGFRSASGFFSKVGEELGFGVEQGARDKLQVHSPSRVFEEIGRNTAEGFAIGVGGDEGIRMPAPRISAVGGGRAVTISIDGIHISGAGDPMAVAAAVEERLVNMLPSRLATALEMMATQEAVQNG
jgi:hypothetical protein